MATLEECKNAHKDFLALCDKAEQYMFPRLLSLDLMARRLLEDLEKNWDEHHAEVFMKYMGQCTRMLQGGSNEETK